MSISPSKSKRDMYGKNSIQKYNSNTHGEHPDHPDDSSEMSDNVRNLRIGTQIRNFKDTFSVCHSYVQFKGTKLKAKYRGIFTHNKYRGGNNDFVWSQRLCLSKEMAENPERRKMPVLIINMDGVLGYWDEEMTHYVIRNRSVEILIQLSYDFRLVAISTESQKNIFKVVHGLMNLASPSDPTSSLYKEPNRRLFFDAVY